jgi:molybdopterin molybdotransferase
MIQVEEALSIIEQNSYKLPVRKLKVSKSLDYVLAEAVYAPIDMPPFRQSAMDGYAFIYGDAKKFEVVNKSKAGSYSNVKIKENQAIRIFTGAYIPDGLDTVVMQEHVAVLNGKIEIKQFPNKFANVRDKGEQIKKDELVLDKNTVINTAAIGFLTCLGITEILVYSKPNVAILVTGNELIKPGKKLPKGKIYESNSVMLEVALQKIGITKVKVFSVKDSLIATKKILKECLLKFDVVLVSGGISVGDYDFVKEALLSNGVEELFYKVNQKPGKPLFFGKKKEALVFGLPGNPASTLSSFYIYVLPALRKRMGFESIHLQKIQREIETDFINNSGKTLFLKALYNDQNVRVLESQSSAMLNTFAVANGLICLPFNKVQYNKGEKVDVIPFNV